MILIKELDWKNLLITQRLLCFVVRKKTALLKTSESIKFSDDELYEFFGDFLNDLDGVSVREDVEGNSVGEFLEEGEIVPSDWGFE